MVSILSKRQKVPTTSPSYSQLVQAQPFMVSPYSLFWVWKFVCAGSLQGTGLSPGRCLSSLILCCLPLLPLILHLVAQCLCYRVPPIGEATSVCSLRERHQAFLAQQTTLVTTASPCAVCTLGYRGMEEDNIPLLS